MLTESQTNDGRTLIIQLAPRKRWILNAAGIAAVGFCVFAILWILSKAAELWGWPFSTTLTIAILLIILASLPSFLVLRDIRNNFTRFEVTQSSLTVHRYNGTSQTFAWSDLRRASGHRFFVVLHFEGRKPVQIVYSLGFRPSIAELKEMFSLAGIPVRITSIGRFLLSLRYIKKDETTIGSESL